MRRYRILQPDVKFEENDQFACFCSFTFRVIHSLDCLVMEADVLYADAVQTAMGGYVLGRGRQIPALSPSANRKHTKHVFS
jgi:hypothetical protein